MGAKADGRQGGSRRQTDVARAEWTVEGLRLRLVRMDERICCEVHLEGEEQPVELGCAPVHLLAVSSGISYHFSGQNAICSLRREGPCVVFEVEIGNSGMRKWSVSLEEYKSALRSLELITPQGYVS